MKKFVAYVPAGYPSMDITMSLIDGLNSEGADLIELGIPYSDPSADGPIIRRSMEAAIRNGFSMKKMFSALSQRRKKESTAEIILFGYLNSFSAYGWSRLITDCKAVGVCDLLILDLPFENSAHLRKFLYKFGIGLIPLVSPATSRERMNEIGQNSYKFVYCVAKMGVTGSFSGESAEEKIQKYIDRVRAYIRGPLYLGFGIECPEQVREVKKYVDGVVVGSHLVKAIDSQIKRSGNLVEAVRIQARPLIEAIQKVGS